MEENLNYTAAFVELQGIINDIESGEISIDQLAEKVKRAGVLIKYCREKLSNTEANVSEILKDLESGTGD